LEQEEINIKQKLINRKLKIESQKCDFGEKIENKIDNQLKTNNTGVKQNLYKVRHL